MAREMTKSEEKLTEIIGGYQGKLRAFLEILRQVLPYPSRLDPDVNLLLVNDYRDLVEIISYMEDNKYKKITTYQLQRNCLKNRGFTEIKVMLLNLERFGYIELSEGDTEYYDISIKNKTIFQK